MLTKEQILELLRENPHWIPTEEATEEEMAWFEEAKLELGLDDDSDDDLDDDLDLDLDEDEDEDDWDKDEDWGDEEL